jgi:hypothetical protein
LGGQRLSRDSKNFILTVKSQKEAKKRGVEVSDKREI